MQIKTWLAASRGPTGEIRQYHRARFDTSLVVYEEALINGQYFLVNWSAMGRPKSTAQIWQGMRDGTTFYIPLPWRPLPRRQYSFQLEVNGQLLTHQWKWISARKETVSEGLLDSVIVLENELLPLRVEIHTELDETPFIVRWLTIQNRGAFPLALAQVFPWSGLVWTSETSKGDFQELSNCFSMGRFRNTEPRFEGEFDWEQLPKGGLHIENVRGRSGHGHPLFLLRNEITKEVAVVDLEWSGNWQVEFYNDNEPAWQGKVRLYAQVGLAGSPPLRILEKGEVAVTARIHLAQMYGDLDTCIQSLHQHLRRSVVPKQPKGLEHLVECNHSGYTQNAQITEKQLLQEVELAADIGCELFIIDAGWFGDAKGSWYEQVGDWNESPSLGHGLGAIFDHARELGMRCGLWVEVERVGLNSHIAKEHPAWLMRRHGEIIPQLDLAKPEVARYVEKTVSRIIEKYKLDCFRLDYNIGVGEGGTEEHDGFIENTMWRYYDALHAIFDNIRKKYPNLLLENCAGGGGRTDLGMMRRFHWTQVSDNWSPVPTLKIINGMTLALPPEQCMTLLGAISEGRGNIDFMLRIGLFSHMTFSGIFPTIEERQETALRKWKHVVKLYKNFVRPIISTCRVFHHTPVQHIREAGEYCILEYISDDYLQGYAGIFRLGNASQESVIFYPKGLNIEKRYQVTFDNSGRSFEIDAFTLVNNGIRINLDPLCSELILFEAVK